MRISPKICILCFSVKLNKRSFEPFLLLLFVFGSCFRTLAVILFQIFACKFFYTNFFIIISRTTKIKIHRPPHPPHPPHTHTHTYTHTHTNVNVSQGKGMNWTEQVCETEWVQVCRHCLLSIGKTDAVIGALFSLFTRWRPQIFFFFFFFLSNVLDKL